MVLTAAWLAFVWGSPQPLVDAPHRQPGEADWVRAESVTPPAAENHRVEVVPATRNRAVFHVTSEGRPVVGASVHEGKPRAAVLLSEESIAVSDANGWMEVDMDVSPPLDSFVVACRGFLSVSIPRPQPVRYDIELKRGSSLRFQCSLETGEPVPDVCILASKSVVPEIFDVSQLLPGSDEATMSAAGVSDSGGHAYIGGIVSGKYLIHASHAGLVQVAGPTNATATEGDAGAVIKLVFCRPVGFVLELEGGDIMANDAVGRGLRVTGPSLSFARELSERFRSTYADSKRFVCVIGVPDPGSSVQPSSLISIWSTDGHYVKIERDLVPIDEDFRPEKLRLEQANRIPHGYIQVSTLGGAPETSDLLAEIYFRPLQNTSPQIAVPREGGLIALPCGDYVGKSRHPQIQGILPRGVLKVKQGETIDWRIDLRNAPRPLAWSARLSDGNTFRRLVLDVRDAAGQTIYSSAGRVVSGVFWLSADCECRASLRIGPYQCEQSILVPRGLDLPPIDFVLRPID